MFTIAISKLLLEIIKRGDLNCIEEEADSWIVLHIACAAKKDFRQFLVLSNDTDVAICNLAYFHVYKTMSVNKIWAKFRILERQRHVPVHQLAEILGTEKSRALLKAHILTGCDVTSKIGSKTAAFNTCPEKYLRLWRKVSRLSLPDGRKVPRKSNQT